MQESIFHGTVRAFFITLFGAIGVILGLAIIGLLIGLVSSSTEIPPQITYTYTPEILPNAKGIRKELSTDAPVILQVNVDGTIGLESLTNQAIRKQLVESREGSFKNNRVKAILLRISSPGGTVVDADGIYHALKHYKEQYKTPIYAYVDGLCASGGMYVACAADLIYASDASLIGSIGVIISPQFNVSQLMEKYGVQSMTLYDGIGKDSLNPFRPWKKGEEDNIKASIDYFYKDFVNIVASNRKEMDPKKLVDVYGASIYPAPQAKEYGYIDVSGASYNEALDALAKKIGIDDDYYQVIELTNQKWYSELFKGETNILHGKVTHTFDLGAEMNPALSGKFLYLYRP